MTTKLFRAVILGPPAAGKGTISQRIASKYNCQHIAAGDILRNNIAKNTELGIKANNYIKDGHLVPDSLVIKCVLEYVNAVGENSWLLDGFPRTAQQSEILHKFNKPDFVINLKVPIEVIVDRIKGRWIHLKSGRVYNTGFNPPKTPFKDDITGENLIQRDDDKPEIVRKRLEIYWTEIEPVLEFYKNCDLLKDFSGNTTNEIWPKIEKFFLDKVN